MAVVQVGGTISVVTYICQEYPSVALYGFGVTAREATARGALADGHGSLAYSRHPIESWTQTRIRLARVLAEGLWTLHK